MNIKNKGRVIMALVGFLLAALIIWFIASALTSKPDKTTDEIPSEILSATETTEQKAKTVDDPLLIIVNKDNRVPDDWNTDMVELSGGNMVDGIVYSDLQRMLDKARKKGYDPIVCSSYRSKGRQKEIYKETVQKYIDQGMNKKAAKKAAREWVSLPGTSEHQLGLAVDIVSASNQVLDTAQEFNPVQRWFMKNCYKYGFILRYPDGKKDVTGIEYEPWHYRYVGKKHAKAMKRLGLCLEEYVEYLKNH